MGVWGCPPKGNGGVGVSPREMGVWGCPPMEMWVWVCPPREMGVWGCPPIKKLKYFFNKKERQVSRTKESKERR